MAIIQRTKGSAKSKAESAKTPVAASAAAPPSPDAVAMRAYQIWREAGSAHGNDQAHWFRAEQELRGRTTPRQNG